MFSKLMADPHNLASEGARAGVPARFSKGDLKILALSLQKQNIKKSACFTMPYKMHHS